METVFNSMHQRLAVQKPALVELKGFLPSVHVSMLRADLMHPILSGNKIWKLLPNLCLAKRAGFRGIASFGGVFSNHIHSLSFACQQLDLSCTLFLRTGQIDRQNPTLKDAEAWGATLVPMDYKHYQNRYDIPYVRRHWQVSENIFFIPEGGGNRLAALGIRQALAPYVRDMDYVLVAVGSGTTFVGAQLACDKNQIVLGIAVMNPREGSNLFRPREEKIMATINWEYHWGGYGRVPVKLLEYCRDFYLRYGIPIEPVYTGKLMYALERMYAFGAFPKGKKLLVVHSGGLQGIRGLQQYRNVELGWSWPLC